MWIMSKALYIDIKKVQSYYKFKINICNLNITSKKNIYNIWIIIININTS